MEFLKNDGIFAMGVRAIQRAILLELQKDLVEHIQPT